MPEILWPTNVFFISEGLSGGLGFLIASSLRINKRVSEDSVSLHDGAVCKAPRTVRLRRLQVEEVSRPSETRQEVAGHGT